MKLKNYLLYKNIIFDIESQLSDNEKITITNKNNVIDLDKIYTQKIYKPIGLWLSTGCAQIEHIENNNKYESISWLEWLNNNSFMKMPLNYDYYAIELFNDKIYHIKTSDEFDVFYFKYKYGFQLINWNAVINDGYYGISICPFRHDKSHIHWYYEWKSSSQCIWNLKAISKIRKINLTEINNIYYNI